VHDSLHPDRIAHSDNCVRIKEQNSGTAWVSDTNNTAKHNELILNFINIILIIIKMNE
jgi:hypothetical protein